MTATNPPEALESLLGPHWHHLPAIMATLHDDAGARRTLAYLKGAVEVVLERCQTAVDVRRQPIKPDREFIQRQVAPIGWDEWLRLLGAGTATLLVVETQKWLLAKKGSTH